jgi:hypothetical protein
MITAKKARKKSLNVDKSDLEIDNINDQIISRIKCGDTHIIHRFIFRPKEVIQKTINILKKNKYKIRQNGTDGEYEISW